MDAADAGPDVLSALTEEERYQRFDALQARMAGVWDAMRLNHDDESVVVVPSITLDRAVALERQHDPGVSRSASCSCSCCCASPGCGWST